MCQVDRQGTLFCFTTTLNAEGVPPTINDMEGLIRVSVKSKVARGWISKLRNFRSGAHQGRTDRLL